MTKSYVLHESSGARFDRVAQAMQILAAPKGRAASLNVAPGKVLYGRVLFIAEAANEPIDRHDLVAGIDLDAIVARPALQHLTNCSILHCGTRYDDYRLCLLPRVSGVAFFTSTDLSMPAFHVVRDRLVEHARSAFASSSEMLNAVARGEAALARLIGAN